MYPLTQDGDPHLKRSTFNLMEWMPHSTASQCAMLAMINSNREASMSEVSIIGIDLAKQVYQLDGACSDGSGLWDTTSCSFLRFM